MGRRKKKRPQEDELIWCYYCDRIFKDEATLITHQKAKHYRCSACNKKMNTAQGLQVHCDQVHKINVDRVPGAKAGRDSMDIEIFGMAGVPEDMRPGGIFEEPRHSAKKVATEANVGSMVSTPPVPAAVPPAPVPQYAIPPQVPVHPGAYPAPQYGMYYAMPPVPAVPGAPVPGVAGMYRPPPVMPPQGQLPPGAPVPFRLPGIPPPLPPAMPPRGPPGVIQPPPLPRGPPGVPLVTGQGAPPPGGALFPIAPSPASGPLPADIQPKPPAPAEQATTATPPPQPGAMSAELDLLWKDEEFSMEERRAQQVKYKQQSAGGTAAEGTVVR